MRRGAAAALLGAAALAGCASIGPDALQQTRLQYNEAVKTTTEEQLLLNIVRLRYGDTPSSLAVSSIAAQFERTQNLQLSPFFTSAGADSNRSFTAILPQAGVAAADRPTMSLTPLDDQEFTRKLFTPMTLDGIIYLAKTTWPISTVFRLYLENLNWVSNAQTASGPTPRQPPEVDDFLRGITALQSLQDRSRIVFTQEPRDEIAGGPLPASSVSARDVLEAAKNGFEYRQDAKAGTWTLVKKTSAPVMLVDPSTGFSPDMQVFVDAFHLQPGLGKYDITQEGTNPFETASRRTGLDLETRSLLQALYYVSHGIDIPPEHAAREALTITRTESGGAYDWQRVMGGLFHVRWAAGEARPAGAQVAVRYHGYWFYIDAADQDTKSTFSLLMELSRLELAGKPGPGPVLTLPVSGR
ncbi:MAG TPA: hypothetical protein VFE23_03345 [Usitatibacter sp.]|nr:hypothetical protein [Usitatibacter sp.]